MKLEKLHRDLKNLMSQYDKKREKILKEYCDKNNPFKIGDRFCDVMGEIVIEEIDYVLEIPCPTCSFTGRKVLKNGKLSPNKRTTYRTFESDYRLVLAKGGKL